MRRGSSMLHWLLLATVCTTATGQSFEIPLDMFSQMMGGGGGGGRPALDWPRSVNSTRSAELSWLSNTEWHGKTTKFQLLSDGTLETDLKECAKRDVNCLWTANNGELLLLTPKTSRNPMRFVLEGSAAFDPSSAERDQAQTASKSGVKSRLKYAGVVEDQNEASLIAEDLYKLLGVKEDTEQSAIKSAYRRLSVQHHPDKGGDKAMFNKLREAYEILGDKDKRGWYDIGGVLLVKNMETAFKEAEGQEAQAMAQLDQQVPRNHPMRPQAEAQMRAQLPSMDDMRVRIVQQMTAADVEIPVDVTLSELAQGVRNKPVSVPRLVICRGCRADPSAPECQECGKCPAEKRQIAEQGPFGMVVGMREVEQESKERCRTVATPLGNVAISKGAADGSRLKRVGKMGHETPGRLPGGVVLVLRRAPDAEYNPVGSSLFTTLHVSFEQAAFGFTMKWRHPDQEQELSVTSPPGLPNDVFVMHKKGLGKPGARSTGDVVVRVVVAPPKAVDGSELVIKAPSGNTPPVLKADGDIEVREDGSIWRRYTQAEGKAQ